MNESLYLNRISYLAKEEKRPSYLLWICLFISLFFWVSCFVEIRLSDKTLAIYNKETNMLELSWPYEEIKEIYQYEKMKVDEETMDFKILNISELKLDEQNKINYQIISIKSPKTYPQSQVVPITLYDKKERMIKKWQKIILGG